GNVVYVGPSVNKLLNFEPEELMGNGWWELTFNSKIEGYAAKQKIIEYANGVIQIDDARYEGQVKDRDGDLRWILWQNSKGLDGLIIGIGQDITKRKAVEKQLIESEAKLKFKNRELETFMYKASHDLKGPLSSSLGLVSIMKEEFGSKDPEIMKYIDMVEGCNLRLDQILMDL
ncbi:MAG: PAS domain S-box protein, partial [Bacteroidetes bacterium]|nr:PAS domain S-box protein [Bacteroidota bacterium]